MRRRREIELVDVEGGDGEGGAVGPVDDVDDGSENSGECDEDYDEESCPEAASAAEAAAAAVVVGCGTVGWARGGELLGFSCRKSWIGGGGTGGGAVGGGCRRFGWEHSVCHVFCVCNCVFRFLCGD